MAVDVSELKKEGGKTEAERISRSQKV